MPAQLRVISGKDSGRVFPVAEGQPVLVGRDFTTHTRLKDPQVAMLHCQVLLTEGKAVLSDRNSTGGVWVNNQRIKEYPLQPGDIFRVGDTRITYEEK